MPESWPDLVTFSSFRNPIEEDDPLGTPELADEWVEGEELEARRCEREARNETPRRVEPRQDETVESPRSERRDPTPAETQPAVQHERRAPEGATPADGRDVQETGEQQRSARTRYQRQTYEPGTGGLERKTVANTLFALAKHLIKCPTAQHDYAYVYALLMDPEYGVMDSIYPHALSQVPTLMKASKSDPDTPTLREAMIGPHREEFIEAMQNEIRELESHDTWTITKRSAVPEGANILPSTWVFRIKRYPDGRFRKTKARFCVRGDKQVEGVDYEDKYAPVVAWSTVRLMLCLSMSLGWETKQVDFSNAFVQAKLKEDVYISLPAGFEGAEGEQSSEVVMKLNRSLYGLVQAPMYWYEHLNKSLQEAGFKPSDLDPCLFYGRGMVVLVYVDDCLFFGPNKDEINQAIEDLKAQKLSLTVEDDDAYAFLGVKVDPNEHGGFTMTQKGLIEKVLKTVGMTESKPQATPAIKEPLGMDADGSPFQEEWNYAAVVGMLLYLSSNSRPDIQFAVHQCAQFTHGPRNSHAKAIKRICRYLKGTETRGLEFTPTEAMELDCYVDADFAGLWHYEPEQDPVCVKSRTGYVITLGGCPVTWVSKLQSEIALSTLEAEYIALSQSMRDLLPMRRVLQEIGEQLSLDFAKPALVHSTIFEDNNGALGLATAPKLTPRTKHIAVKYHWFKSHIGEEQGFVIKKVESENQKADIFTKGLVAETFQHVRKLLMGW